MGVSEAVFQQKGTKFVKQKRAKIDQKAKIRKMEQQQALSWNDVRDDSSATRIVVLMHMFAPKDLIGKLKRQGFARSKPELDAKSTEDLKVDVGDECRKFGEIEKAWTLQRF